MIGITTPAAEPPDDEEDYPPGLVAKFASPVKDRSPINVVERIDPDVQFPWGLGSPDARLHGDSFEVTWSGKLLVRAEGKYRFHLFVQGTATAMVNGRTVVEGQRETIGWLDGPETPLDFGEHSLSITYRKTQPVAHVRLFWSCRDSFPLEPIPPQILFHDTARADLKRLERGRDLFETLRCNRCHRRDHDPASPPGPDLTRAATDLNRDWLVDWLRHPADASPHSRMPSFGFSMEEAAAIADFLVGQSKTQKPAPVAKAKPAEPDDARKGELLFRSVGCLACHTHGELGQPQVFSGGDLAHVGRKRSFDWLIAWLADPEKLNADHRMPVVKLSETERRQIAAYLLGNTTGNAKRVPGVEQGVPPERPTTRPAGGSLRSPPATQSNAALGRDLVQTARCADCHRIPGVERPRDGAASLAEPVRDLSKSCLRDAVDSARHRPRYNLSDDDRAALRSFIESRRRPLSDESLFTRGARLLREKNCLACHERDGSRGIAPTAGAVAKIDPDLQGQSEALIPPDLTAVGDKLRDEALALAIRGDQPTVRMPWLRVRMPRFAHSPDETAALQAYLIGHDRIPSGQTIEVSKISEASTAAPADETQRRNLVSAGRKLVGAQGWSCTACHRVGDFEPRNVALGTRGSNLHKIGDRMRPEFFLRWTRSPLRIIPGMEMPSYEKPVAGILDAHVPKQLGAVWEALNDAVSPVSADVANVEQIVTVSPGQPARIIRDVFRLPPPSPPQGERGPGGEGQATPGAARKQASEKLAPHPQPLSPSGGEGSQFVPRAFVVGLNNGVNLLFDLDAMALRRVWLGETARQRPSGKSWFWEPSGTLVFDNAASDPDIALRKRRSNPEDAIPKGEESTLLVARRDFAQYGRLIDYAPYRDGVVLTYRMTFKIDRRDVTLPVAETWTPERSEKASYPTVWRRSVVVEGIPDGFEVVATRGTLPTFVLTELRRLDVPGVIATRARTAVSNDIRPPAKTTSTPDAAAAPPVHPPATLERLACVPGFEVTRLPLERGIMPTALTWNADGRLVFCSLKGHVFTARDTDGDGIEDQLAQFEEGLAAPYGIILDANSRDLLVAHKPELLRLRDTDGDGKADVREVVATGWGYSEDYHDWTFGIVRDSRERLYIGLGSDYANKGRPPEISRWRGTVLRVDPEGQITPMGHAFRYPTGLAITPDDQVFVSDNQGVQNTFNEINHLVEGAHYGVPALHDEKSDQPPRDPAIKVPHPWTRSVNGIFFWNTPSPPKGERGPGGEGRALESRLQPVPPKGGTPTSETSAPHPHPLSPFGGEGRAAHPFSGHGIGCEYDTKALVRFTLQRVGDTFQGAVYPFTTPDIGLLLGTLCGGVAPNGDIYIGCIHDSGWLGGRNVGEIVRLHALHAESLPQGIRELRATADGMVIDFTAPVNRAAASRVENYSVSGYTRKWQGAYATPDSARHKVEIKSVEVSPDDRQVTLRVDRWQAGFVYEVSCARIGLEPQAALWPAVGHYTMNVVPEMEQKETKGTKK